MRMCILKHLWRDEGVLERTQTSIVRMICTLVYCCCFNDEQVITRELFGYSADVICLQECDKKVFDTVLQPVSIHITHITTNTAIATI
jgi:hypothetical protein